MACLHRPTAPVRQAGRAVMVAGKHRRIRADDETLRRRRL